MTRVLLIAYEGKEKESGRVFDRVEEEEPYAVILGEDSLLPGLAEALEKMKDGEEREIELPPQKAFGERQNDLIVVIPEREFRKRKVVPVPGLVIDADGRSGKVLSVSGGRVQVDFNHELAGKTVIYRVKVLAELKGAEEVAEALFRRFMRSKLDGVSYKDGVLEVVYTPSDAKEKNVQKLLYVAAILKAVPDVKEVRITEKYVRKEEKGKNQGES